MGVLFLISVFRLYPRLKMTFEHNSVRKNLFLGARFCWDSRLPYVRWIKNLNLVDSLVMETLAWTLYSVTPKYSDCMQYYTMLL